MEWLENRTFDELEIGEAATVVRVLHKKDIELFAAVSGDVNPAHLDADYAKSSPFHDVVAHGMWGGALLSAALGTKLPGPGTIYVGQTLEFKRPVRIGDRISVTVRVAEKHADKGRVIFDCECRNQDDKLVIGGRAEVIAPKEKLRLPLKDWPRAYLYERGDRLSALVEGAKTTPPLVVAVAHPTNDVTLSGALEAARAGLIEPILVGPRARIEAAAEKAGENLADFKIEEAPHSHAAAAAAVRLVREGRAGALMKGALHTDEIMGEVVARESGLRTERRVSHVYVMDAPAYDKLLFITDAAINIYPDLDEKRDIIQNAIDLARTLGVDTPKVAVLSAVETVYPPIRSTVEAAALCKMADRGQIQNGVLDGPLAFDNAISKEAARVKGIASDVAGDADILLAPDLEAGNMLAKQLDYLAGAMAAGIVLGARAPIILTSRAEKTAPRLASCAIAKLYLQNRPALSR